MLSLPNKLVPVQLLSLEIYISWSVRSAALLAGSISPHRRGHGRGHCRAGFDYEPYPANPNLQTIPIFTVMFKCVVSSTCGLFYGYSTDTVVEKYLRRGVKTLVSYRQTKA